MPQSRAMDSSAFVLPVFSEQKQSPHKDLHDLAALTARPAAVAFTQVAGIFLIRDYWSHTPTSGYLQLFTLCLFQILYIYLFKILILMNAFFKFIFCLSQERVKNIPCTIETTLELRNKFNKKWIEPSQRRLKFNESCKIHCKCKQCF